MIAGLALPLQTAAATLDPRGTYSAIGHRLNPCCGDFPNTWTINTFNPTTGQFAGQGRSNSAGSGTPDYTISGTLAGSQISVHIVYQDGSGYISDNVGTVQPDLSMSGTWTDSLGQSGTWSASPTCAGITTSGAITAVPPPPSLLPLGTFVSTTQIRFWCEQQSVTIQTPLAVDAAPGSSPTTIAAGTIVDSFFIHAEAPPASATYTLDGSVTVSEPILGIAFNDATLNGSDFLSPPGTVNLNGVANRGLEPPDGDSATIGSDGRTVTVHLSFSEPGDEVRIITVGTAQTCFAAGIPETGIEVSPTTADVLVSLGVQFPNKVATFTDAAVSAPPSSYKASINWGDGTTTSGVITPNLTGGCEVAAQHSYTTVAHYQIRTTVQYVPDGRTGVNSPNSEIAAVYPPLAGSQLPPFVGVLTSSQGPECTATVIEPDLILTALHCVDGQSNFAFAPHHQGVSPRYTTDYQDFSTGNGTVSGDVYYQGAPLGAAPYGVWTTDKSPIPFHDVDLAILEINQPPNQYAGKQLIDVVGAATPLRGRAPATPPFTIFGYDIGWNDFQFTFATDQSLLAFPIYQSQYPVTSLGPHICTAVTLTHVSTYHQCNIGTFASGAPIFDSGGRLVNISPETYRPSSPPSAYMAGACCDLKGAIVPAPGQ